MATKPKLEPVPADTAVPTFLDDYRPAPRQRVCRTGWTAKRQRTFLVVLAETGCVSQACRDAGVSSRSAYRLRQEPGADGFARAWDQALRLATVRLTSVAYERAINGTVKEFWRDDQLVAKTRAPSDKLLTFLLQHLLPREGKPSRLDEFNRSLEEVGRDFPATLDTLVDNPVEMVPIEYRDFYPEEPGDPAEDW